MNNKKIAITINNVLRDIDSSVKSAYEILQKKREHENKNCEEGIEIGNDFMGLCKRLELKFVSQEEYETFLFETFKFNIFSASKMISSHYPSTLIQFFGHENLNGNEVTIVVNDNYKDKDLTSQTLYWLGRSQISIKKLKVIYDNKELYDFDEVVSADPNYQHKNKIEITNTFTFLDYVKQKIEKNDVRKN